MLTKSELLSGNKRGLENDYVGSNERITQRVIANSSDPKQMIQNVPNGIRFISLMNERKRFFLPSTKNSFGGIKVKKLLCHSGCSSLLLPIASLDQLHEIFQLFPGSHFKISSGRRVGGNSLSLTDFFHAKLCQDILDSPNIPLKMIRFSLSTEDINEILMNNIYKAKFNLSNIVLLESQIKVHLRRDYGLLGQEVMQCFSSIKHGACELHVDSQIFIMPPTFVELGIQIDNLVNQIVNLPEGFEEWEDDYAFEDD
eukprot:gene5438-7371_t